MSKCNPALSYRFPSYHSPSDKVSFHVFIHLAWICISFSESFKHMVAVGFSSALDCITCYDISHRQRFQGSFVFRSVCIWSYSWFFKLQECYCEEQLWRLTPGIKYIICNDAKTPWHDAAKRRVFTLCMVLLSYSPTQAHLTRSQRFNIA